MRDRVSDNKKLQDGSILKAKYWMRHLIPRAPLLLVKDILRPCYLHLTKETKTDYYLVKLESV